MEAIRVRVNAAERAKRKAKVVLDEAREKGSRLSAKLTEYENRLQTARRGRELDTLRKKYDTLQDRLMDSRTEIRHALDAHARLSEKYLALLDHMVDAENASESKRSKARYEETEPTRRGWARRRNHTTHTTYHYGSLDEGRKRYSQGSDGSSRLGRTHSFEGFARHEQEGESSRLPCPAFVEEGYTTEEHVPRSHRRHRRESAQSSEDEDKYTSNDYGRYHPGYGSSPSDRSEQDFHPGYASSDHGEQIYTTEEHVPWFAKTHGAHYHQSSRDHSPPSDDDYHYRREQYTHYSTEEHEPRTAHRSYGNGSQPSSSRTSRNDERDHSSSRSRPRPQQRRREDSREDHFRRSESSRPQPDDAQPTKFPSRQTVASWWKYANRCFEDYSAIEWFPVPPALSCGKPNCDAVRSSRPLAACECTIRASFGMVPNLNIKRERLRWHPDKFTACSANLREGFQEMASDVFIVLDKMHKE